MSEEDKPRTRLVPVSQWGKFHPWPTVAGLRYLVQHAERKNFRSVYKKVNGRILIDEAAFFEWVKAEDEKAQDQQG